MCGIVGAIAERNVAAILLDGLKRLEYRGYDSAGIAVIDSNDQCIERRRVKGKVQRLVEEIAVNPLSGNAGIAHTRWATHGIPCEQNAHPQVSGKDIAIVHNGIIENHNPLRQKLIEAGYKFNSETDTEVIAHLIHFHFNETRNLIKAIQTTIKALEGAFALGIMHQDFPSQIIAVRQGSPLVLGVGINEHFIASDPLALLPVTQKFIYLEEGDLALFTSNHYEIIAATGNKAEREIHKTFFNADSADRGPYRHFMLKEIFEQPRAISETLEGRSNKRDVNEYAFGVNAKNFLNKVENIHIVACGTSFHAALTGQYWLQNLLKLPCYVDIASEYRYREIIVPLNTLLVTISQSGETADTLAALRKAKKLGYLTTLTICNVSHSSLVRESDNAFITRAGAEIGVASTKAFTTQLTALLLLTLTLGQRHNHLNMPQIQDILKQLNELPAQIENALSYDQSIQQLAAKLIDKQHALFLGRGIEYPVAKEGALKMKEISYIHAEAYPAGELKHGPLALIDNTMPIIAIVANDELLEKMKSNLHEAQARSGKLIIITDRNTQLDKAKHTDILELPPIPQIIAPIVYTVPLQLLAYHIANYKGTDIDQPRNLAKSVTVE